MSSKRVELIRISQSCRSAEVIWKCKEHGINKPLEVAGLVPFNLSADMVDSEDVRHVVPDWQLELVKHNGHKTLFVFCWKWF